MQGNSDPNRELLDAAALVGHLVPAGSVYRFLAEHRHRLFPDEMFADLFPSGRGRPSVPADVIATVMVLQALEGLSDREAVEALRTDLRWKVAAGLALDDEGFHPTVLTLWRNKLRRATAPERIFDAVRDVVDGDRGVEGQDPPGAGLDGARRRGRDPGHRHPAGVDDPPGPQAIPAAAAVEVAAHDYDSPGKPGARGTTRPPDELVTGLVNDALRSSPPSTGSTSTTSNSSWSGCWRWSPARTSNPIEAARARGGSPAGSRRTG